MSRETLDALSEYHEVNLFLRGIVPTLGYQTSKVYYERGEREAGESKYPLKKMISFALDGITSFSVKPLKIISNLGILVSVLSVGGLIFASGQVFDAQRICHQIDHDHRVDGADDGVLDAVYKTGEQRTVCRCG